jgi:hypothetical protein
MMEEVKSFLAVLLEYFSESSNQFQYNKGWHGDRSFYKETGLTANNKYYIHTYTINKEGTN